ncbi:MAG: pullulanase-type alpha-1,6-glucosidase [Proteobacteria bacterium]|nr:pullulanase-type alpha-1,6-glucosidase [Pseudomonadota bacterium]
MFRSNSKLRPWLFMTVTIAIGSVAACTGQNPDTSATDHKDIATSAQAGASTGTESGEEIPCPQKGTFADARAHWVDVDTIAWPSDSSGRSFELVYANCQIRLSDANVEGGDGILALVENPDGLPTAVQARFPHLAQYRSLQIASGDVGMVGDILDGQFILVERDAGGDMIAASQVQTPGVLDALYRYDGALGTTFSGKTPSFQLWAPTARWVKLHVYHSASKDEIAAVGMTENNGVWTATGDSSWYGHYYRYEVYVFIPALGEYVANMVTDPYSVGLSTNSEYSLIIDLDDPATKPSGWDDLVKPELEAPEDITLYELHIRDFSGDDSTVSPADRGKYTAFTYDGYGGRPLSDGMRHLGVLGLAGLTHIHLLPSFDIATINEDASQRVDLDNAFDLLCSRNRNVPAADCAAYSGMTIRAVLDTFEPGEGDVNNPDTANIQRIVGYMRELDSFNWGYDPYHYTTPEGSYATNPDGITRIVEFRSMVQALARKNLRTVIDVVYNHTNASGQSYKSVLDRIVPGYYHRRNQVSGNIERSTCCENTATEHAMMAKLMVDSVVTWARQYKIDGFRFDLMGHHMKSNMEEVQSAVESLTVAEDGVDGSKIYIYGEGWNFGEVANGARGENATQLNMAGTGIGTFSDRLRDAVRGGGPFDGAADLRKRQGFATGLYYDANELNSGAHSERDELLHWADTIRVGMAGNLADFVFENSAGTNIRGSSLSYFGSPAGYTDDPQEVITYVCAHDNQTLWDNNQYKLPTGTSMADRVRVQNLGISIVTLSQGIPFMHAGAELLRSKSMERDSYNSGGWFNKLDFSYRSNNWNVGLPRHDKDGLSWNLIKQIIGDASIDPTQSHIKSAARHFGEMLVIRKTSPLFRLRSKAEVMQRVDFLNTGADQQDGLIVMTITDGTCAGPDLDENLDSIVVLINANDEAQSFVVPGASQFYLHPVQSLFSQDLIVRNASFDDAADRFSIPARTTAVFIQPQSGGQGVGLPCNVRVPIGVPPVPGLQGDVFVRGQMNNWVEPPPDNAKFVQDATNSQLFTATLTLEAGSHEFKIASAGWSPHDWGKSGATLAPGDPPAVMVSKAGNMTLNIATDGDYVFTLDISDIDNPTIQID